MITIPPGSAPILDRHRPSFPTSEDVKIPGRFNNDAVEAGPALRYGSDSAEYRKLTISIYISQYNDMISVKSTISAV